MTEKCLRCHKAKSEHRYPGGLPEGSTTPVCPDPPEYPRWYEDPGHAWLAVPVSDVIGALLMEHISHYSYRDFASGIIYLEEDCDAALYLRAAGISFETAAKFPIEYSNEDSFIRNLPRVNT